jgi:hypothetical protein
MTATTVDITIAELLEMHEAAQSELQAFTQAFTAEVAPLKQMVEDTEMLLLDKLNDAGVKSTTVETDTHNISVRIDVKQQFSISDREAFNAWVIENQAATVFQARINVAALEQVTDDIPPGVSVFRKNVVVMRRTMKKI